MHSGAVVAPTKDLSPFKLGENLKGIYTTYYCFPSIAPSIFNKFVLTYQFLHLTKMLLQKLQVSLPGTLLTVDM